MYFPNILLYLHLPTTWAIKYIQYNDSFPSDTTAACINAVMGDLSCPDQIMRLRPDAYYPTEYLSSVCITECRDAIRQYESAVDSACQDQNYDTETDAGSVSIATIPHFLGYLFDYSCLSDSANGQYCSVEAATAIGIAPDQSNLNSPNATGGGNLSCTDCALKSLQAKADSAFYGNDDILSMYSSLTSSCQATGYPLATPTFSFNTTATTTPAPIPTCGGTAYSIKSGDDCQSISKSESIGTAWLLMDNNLPANCASFPSNGSLCIGHTCTTYTVQQNDTCESIMKAHSINYAQILSWNPVISNSCGNLNSSVGDEICVSSPGPAYTIPPSQSTVSVTSVTTAAPVPTDAANGTVTNCGLWYKAVAGDYCNLITIRYGLSLADFLILNPEVNENCTNLFVDESYCVEPVGDISNYPGAPGYAEPIPDFSTIPWSSLPSATNIPDPYVGPNTNLTRANGTRSDCRTYLSGADYQLNLSNTTIENNCELVVAVFNIGLDDLLTWNPSLSASNCSFDADRAYCARLAFPEEPTSTTSVMPTATGIVVNCTQYSFASIDTTCQDILDYWNISMPYFAALNPALGSDCSGLKKDTYYCVGTSDNVTVTTSVTPPAPTQTGIPANCNAYYVAQQNDDCGTVEKQFGITDAQFHAWNPAVSSDCLNGFWLGEAYCVGIAGDSGGVTTTATTSSSSETTSKTSVSSTTITSVTPPGPTQSGIPSECNKYYVAQTNDNCNIVETKFAITDQQFHQWNPAVSADCLDGFWLGEAYCVGVSS